MSWSQAKRVLLEKVVPLMTDPTKGTAWINNLENEVNSRDGRRLGVCIAIDILSDALEPEVFASILDLVDLSESDARRGFGLAFDRHPNKERFAVASKLGTGALDSNDSYIRVLLLRDFIEYYVSPNNPHSFDPSDVEDVRISYFDEGADADLADIETWWTGRNGVVWIMSYNDHLQLTSKIDPDNRGTLLNDALGLGKGPSRAANDGVEVVAVKYPETFDHPCSQPSTLDAYWVDSTWYYISYIKEDGWGRTQGCSGSTKAIRERVHATFEGLSSDYSGLYIGLITNLVQARERLLPEAYRRLAMIAMGD